MSLRKAGNVRIDKSGFWGFLGERKIFFSKNQYFEIQQYKAEKLQEEHGAAKVGKDGHRVLWWAKSGFYWADGNLSDDEVLLLIWGRENKQKAQIERLREVREFGETVVQTNREMIPQETRAIVWRRDGGQCVQCGARDDLQYDHIIPVSKGGGNSPQNLQILCGPCNRKKSDSI